MATTAADAYPLSRYDRNPPSVVSPPAAVVRSSVPPRSRFFTVEMGASANARGTCSTPKIIGPAIVQGVKIRHRTATDPAGFAFELGWSTFPVTEANVALTTTKPWNALCERLRHFYETPAPNLVGMVEINNIANLTQPFQSLDAPLLVSAAEFYLTLTYINATAAVNPFAVYAEVFVLENISPEVAANFH